MSAPVGYFQRLVDLARQDPDAVVLRVAHADSIERTMTRHELLGAAHHYAEVLRQNGAQPGSFVVIGLPNGLEHVIAALAAWGVGACAVPLSPAAPPHELERVTDLLHPVLVIGRELADQRCIAAPQATARSWPRPGEVWPIPNPGKAIASGGSTGAPKIIMDARPWAAVPDSLSSLQEAVGFRAGMIQLVPGPLYHNTPFGWLHQGLFHGHSIILMERFDAARAVNLIERHEVQFLAAVPTMMSRIARLPVTDPAAFRSLQALLHTAASCPGWLKQHWLDTLAPERVYEAYGATDYIGACAIRGDEWLAHPGSVGRPVDCDVRILDDSGQQCGPGEVGAVFMRRHLDAPAFSYLGVPQLGANSDGFQTVGDLGWLDEDGYLYIADRRDDLIVSGGANVYPAEVEAVISELASVADCAVIGITDDDLGFRVHALVQPVDGSHPPTPEDVISLCRSRLVSYKCPRTVDIVPALPRTSAGKLRRSQLVANCGEHGKSG